MAPRKKESVSVSFHYLTKNSAQEAKQSRSWPFSQQEFDQLYAALKSKPKMNLKSSEVADRLRYRSEVPIEKVELLDKRSVFGEFKASYWGHSYENTEKGNISADSISLRPFKFLLYLSDDGKIFIGCQYLGQFGGYGGLKSTICELLEDICEIDDEERIAAHSFRIDNFDTSKIHAREVRVAFSGKSTSITRGNVFTNTGVIAFKKQPGDDSFESQVADRLLSLAGQSSNSIKKALATMLNENDLMSVEDVDIEDCTVIASVNGKKKTLYLLEEGSFASKFPLSVGLNADGHPVHEQTKKAMREVLKSQIISRQPNV